jgi:signal transduction histidine kinase
LPQVVITPPPRSEGERSVARAESRDLNSQQALAASIARSVAAGLPASGAEDHIADSVGEALRVEMRRSELTLAELRVGILALVVLAGAAAGLRAALSEGVGIPWPSLAFAVAWLAGAIGFAWALRRGWYRSWFRRAVPAGDASMLALGAVLYISQSQPDGEVFTGITWAVAIGCFCIAFSGAVRLSRSGAIIAAVLAIATWTLYSMLAGLGPLEFGFVAATAVGAGALGARAALVIRRVVATEVGRLQLTRMYADARQAIEAREEVLRIVSHDLRNPLNNVSLAADMLIEDEVPADEQVKRLRIIKRAAHQMDRLIGDLLDVARLEAGTLSVSPTSVPVHKLLEELSEAFTPLAEEHSIELEVISSPELPAVLCDAERIHQVFSNLVGNAVKFTPAHGHITVRADRAGERVRFSIVDTGPGIPADQLATIFGRFWQARPSDRRGIGLGLTIAKSIIEAHGERIGVDSRPGEGSSFWFTLPVARDTAGASLSPDHNEHAHYQPGDRDS